MILFLIIISHHNSQLVTSMTVVGTGFNTIHVFECATRFQYCTPV